MLQPGGRPVVGRWATSRLATTPLLSPRRPAARQLCYPRRIVAVAETAAPPATQRGGERRPAAAQPAPAAAPAPAAPAKGSLFGAIALITGSTVGAGMLVLPAVSAPAGIVPTSASLLVVWGVLTLDALLICEVNLAARDARDAATSATSDATSSSSSSSSGSNSDGGAGAAQPAGAAEAGIISLRQMAEFSLGAGAGKGFTLIYLGLAYSLLTAYTTKAAEVLDFFAGGGLPPLAPAAAFVGGIGGLLYLGGTRSIDAVNQSLTSVLLALFAVILTAGAAQSGLPISLAHGAADWGALQPAVPIMFLALVYHDLIPVIVSYLGGDRRAIRSAIVVGSLVPLAMFLSWEAVALSLLPTGLGAAVASGGVMEASLQLAGGAAAADPGAALSATALAVDGPAAIAVDPLEVMVRRTGPLVGRAVEAFSFLAVATSFIGTTLSLSETLRTEVPQLLREGSRLLRRSTGADASVSADLSEDELACLRAGGTCDGGNGCSVSYAAAPPDEAAGFSRKQERGVALLLTLCPPLALAAANPDNFLGALAFAGGYGMTLLYGLLPPLMAWQLRSKLRSRQRPAAAAHAASAPPAEAAVGRVQEQWLAQSAQQDEAPHEAPPRQPWWRQQHEEMVPGGAPVLAGLFVAAVAVIEQRFVIDAGLDSGASATEAADLAQGLLQAVLHNPSQVPEAVLALLQGVALPL